jgi:hypothetical protein
MIFGFSSHFILAYWGGIGMWSFQKAEMFWLSQVLPARERISLIVRAQCVRGGSRNFEYWWRNNLNIYWRQFPFSEECVGADAFVAAEAYSSADKAPPLQWGLQMCIFIYIFLGSSGKLSQRPQSWFDKRYLMNYWGQLGFQTCTWKAKRPLWLMRAQSHFLV